MSLSIARPLRAWFAVEVLFGVLAISAVGLAPDRTATNFAWSISPTVMAATLGAFYIASAPLFIMPLFAKRWVMVRVLVLPVVAFSLVQLVATFVHWDKFHVDSAPFAVWFASYVLPPPIFLAGYWWHQRRTGEEPVTVSLAPAVRGAAMVIGALFVALALVMLFAPGSITGRFAWKLTPLTAGSAAGWLVAVGGMHLSIARENDVARSRLATPFLIVPLPALLVQWARFADEVDWGSAALWLVVALFSASLLCGLALTRGSWRETFR